MKTIPLVVHILYNTPEQNISDAQINSQVTILNQDFSRTNPDASKTPSAFSGVASNSSIQFCLVKVIRKQTNVKEFINDNAIKFCKTGGSDALDVKKYMNVWVGKLGGGLLGYGEFPNTKPSNTYGVVINYQAFGNMGTARSPYNKGRTLTHEMGHCFSLYHIFEEGVNLQSCKKTDYVLDIPTQSTRNFGCPSFPHTEKCAYNPPGVMFMNFLDYTDDACMNIFTKDQSARMNATLSIAPYDKLATTGCVKNEDEIKCDASPSNKEFLSWKSYFNWKNILIGIGIITLIVIIVVVLKKKKII